VIQFEGQRIGPTNFRDAPANNANYILYGFTGIDKGIGL